MESRIVNEIAGNVAPERCEVSTHPITQEERSFAVEIGREVYARAGIDVEAAAIEVEAEDLAEGLALGYSESEIRRMWAGR
jgi:hypothetical protein